MPTARAERGGTLVALFGAVLAFASIAAHAAEQAPAPTPPAPIVDHVVYHVPPGYDDADYVPLIKVHAGDPLNHEAIRDSIAALYAKGPFSDVVVREIDEPDGGSPTIIFDLTAESRIQHMVFLGRSALSNDDLTHAALAALAPAHGANVTSSLPAPFFPEELEAMRRALERAYDRRGYPSAEVKGVVEQLDRVNVDVQFDIDEGPPTRIGAISFTGDPELPTAELLEALGLKVGDTLDRERLDQGLENLRDRYRKSNYFRAEVDQPQIVRDPSGERASLSVPVQAGPAIHFHFHGNRTFSEAELESALDYGQDEVLDEDKIADLANKVRQFYQLSGFYEAQVTPQEVDSPDRRQATVAFVIDEGLPLAVTALHFKGNHHFSEGFLVDRVHESLIAAVPEPPDLGGLPIDEAESAVPASDRPRHVGQYRVTPETVFADKAYQEALGRIEEHYRADGYLDTVVSYPSLDIDERNHTAEVTITVNEGPITHLDKITLVGVPDGPKRLLAQSSLEPGQPVSSLANENTRVALEHSLQREGYLFATVGEKERRYDDDKTKMEVLFEANPGPRVRVRRIIITGNDRTREGIIAAGITLQEGDYFDPEKMQQTQRNLFRLGIFTRVDVEPLEREHPEAEKDLLVSVDERARMDLTHGFGYSLVDGPRYTADLVLSNLAGQGFDLVVQGKLNYFNWSYPVLGSPGGPDQIQAQPDVIYGFAGHVNVGFRNPSLFNSAVGGHVDVVAEREERPAYYFYRVAVLGGIDWKIAGPVTASFSTTPFEVVYLKQQEGLALIVPTASQGELQTLLFPIGTTYLGIITPSISLDLRDNATNPHKGFWASVNAEFAHDYNWLINNQGQNPAFFTKPSVTMKGYIPLGPATLGLTASAGRVYALEANSTTIGPERFFLGGASTLRGYPQDGLTPEDVRSDLHTELNGCRGATSPLGCTEQAEVLNLGYLVPSEGGQAFVLYKAELRIPVGGGLELGVFVDAGDLWLEPPDFKTQFIELQNLRITPGFGIHYNTPLGSISLDLGFNATPDTLLNETVASAKYLQFSIGQF